MEQRTINANDLLESIQKEIDTDRSKDYTPHECDVIKLVFTGAKGLVEKQPTIGTAPVVHGLWKYFHKQNCAVCTNCSFERDLDLNFGRAVSCPNCGAIMSNVMEYKGYRAKIECSAEDKTFIGNVLGVSDVLAFDGETISQLEDMFHDNIDDYLVMCKEFEKEGTTLNITENKRPMKLVVHGMWLERGSPRTTLWNCSVCGNSPHISSRQTDYCPHCGAKMVTE